MRNKPANAILLARQGQRKGRETPDLREETRYSPTRGVFHRKGRSQANGEPHRAAELRGSVAPTPFSLPEFPCEGRSHGT